MTDDQYLARTGQPLATHLDGVAENARHLVLDGATTPADNSLVTLVDTLAQLHDLGKYTTFFQEYLTEPGHRTPRRREQHADVGAFLALQMLEELGFEVPAVGLHAVLRHHGAMPNVQTYHRDVKTDPTRFEILGEKLEDIDRHAAAIVDDRLKELTDGALGWTDIYVDEPMRYRARLPSATSLQGQYGLLLRTWSTLTCADKLDAAELPIEHKTRRPAPDNISFDTDTAGITAELDELRGQARDDCRTALSEHVNAGESVFTLTLPTGFGKTFTGLDAALTLADRTGGRVIYALPYTTVIDQVHEAVTDQFGVSPTSQRYTIHHHLTDTRTQVGGDGSQRPSRREEALFGESWQAGLVLTTFVQLFESLAGPGNLQSIKLPALQDSVILLDEPQALPYRWWSLGSHLISTLVEEYDATVVLMTATQPRFVDESSFDVAPTEVVPNPSEYFAFLGEHQRVRFHVDESVQDAVSQSNRPSGLVTDTAASRLLERANDNSSDVLSITNTVESAARIGAGLDAAGTDDADDVVHLNDHVRPFRSDLDSGLLDAVHGDANIETQAANFLATVRNGDGIPDAVTMTLTAALRPVDRSLLIATIRQVVDGAVRTPLDDVPFVVSATQLIEAGVDVSFDHVYRDIAPIPSVVQAAGRCNRSFEGEQGTVTLWRLGGEGSPPSEIYTRGRDLLQPTHHALRETLEARGPEVAERTMVEGVVESYYSAIHDADLTGHRSDPLIDHYQQAEGEELRAASLIEDDSEEFLVVADESDLDRLRTYLQEREDGTIDAGQTAFGALKHLLASARPTDDVPVDTASVLETLGYDSVSLQEFDVVDARDDENYSVGDGSGLRGSRSDTN
jgi:CRISPR-associated endonuclease Cas3-HD